METIASINREIDRLFTYFHQIYSGLWPVPESDKQRLLNYYEEKIHIARQVLANRKEVERLIQRVDLLNWNIQAATVLFVFKFLQKGLEHGDFLLLAFK